MRKVFTVVAVVILVVVLGLGANQYFNSRTANDSAPLNPFSKDDSSRGGAGKGDKGKGEQKAPSQPSWCPRAEVIAAPGTWESKKGDDPINPTANKYSFMLKVTKPLQREYTREDVKVWTLPYTAEFKNINSQGEMSYDESRDEGTATLKAELKDMHEQCPETKFVLTGFSQGAVIVGDVVDRIGAGNGPVPADAVAGVALVADGRRENGVGINPGTDLDGIGAEIALAPVEKLVQPIVPGASMRGPRTNDFGELADRTYQICAPNDSICDAPQDIANALPRAMDLVEANGVHARYAKNKNVIDGTTTDKWLVGWAKKKIAEI